MEEGDDGGRGAVGVEALDVAAACDRVVIKTGVGLDEERWGRRGDG